MEHNQYIVVVSSVVYDELNSHIYFLARVSADAAKRLKSTLLKDMKSLSEMPERNPPYERPWLTSGKYRYKLSADRYRIVFEIDGNIVRVNGVEDCRQNEISRYR